ncbi:MAG: TIGR03546 family protein [Melioribacteraceae bacterium]|nr:TIGR03546 family protein [Melioribacteraceae bacterium]
MFWLKIIKDFIKIFREGQSPAQVAGGFALGSILGLSPIFTLQGLILWILIALLNVNLGAVFLALTAFSIIAYLFDPFFHWFGFQILTQIDWLKDFWTTLYNAPVAPLTNFNNTVIMGSFVTAIILAIPIYFGMKKLIVQYRKHLHTKIEKIKIYQVLRQSSLVKLYTKLRDFGGVQ